MDGYSPLEKTKIICQNRNKDIDHKAMKRLSKLNIDMSTYDGFCNEEQWTRLASGMKQVLHTERSSFDIEAALEECKRVLLLRPKITALPIEIMSTILSKVPGFDKIEVKWQMMTVNKPFKQAMMLKDSWTRLTIHVKRARVVDVKHYQKIAGFLEMVDHIEIRGGPVSRISGRPGWTRVIEKFMPQIRSMTLVDVIDDTVSESLKTFVSGLKKLEIVRILTKNEVYRLVLRRPEGAECISFKDPLAYSELSWQYYGYGRDSDIVDVKKMRNLRFLGLISTVSICKSLLRCEDVEFDLSRLHVKVQLFDLFGEENIPNWLRCCKSTDIVTSFRRILALSNTTSLSLNSNSWSCPLDDENNLKMIQDARMLNTLKLEQKFSRVTIDFSRLPKSLQRLDVKSEALSLSGKMHDKLLSGSGRFNSSISIHQEDDVKSTMTTARNFKRVSCKKMIWGDWDDL